ncbi:protein FAM210A [Lethenteron reissneri]|uniref:protein FAM210A n=1 Tax=Lethenteron reissneri TaxID=7753 RepID=UPI002AB78CE1|nr:protein FAM210A [Lethenteron reissneri]XP_061429256.1 protein FAM210A [Lethenteron reissneri]
MRSAALVRRLTVSRAPHADFASLPRHRSPACLTRSPASAALWVAASPQSRLLARGRLSCAALHSAPGRDPQQRKVDPLQEDKGDPLQEDKGDAQRGADPLRAKALEAEGNPQPASEETDPLQDRSMGLISRFKRTLKQYGKVMIPVHLVTSAVWFGSFYYAAMRGVNVLPMLEALGFPEKFIKLLHSSQGGNLLTAYALYKIATPARYTVTLGGTSYTVKYLRKRGILNTPPPPNVKQFLQDKMDETREKISEKVSDTREKISEKVSDTREKISEKVSDTREKISEKVSDTREKISEKVQDTKNRVAGKK